MHDNKEGKCIGALRKCFYSTIKGCNYLACMVQLIYSILDYFSDIMPHLPHVIRTCALHLQNGGLSATNRFQQQNISWNLQQSSAVALCHFAWLHSTTLPVDTRFVVEDMALACFTPRQTPHSGVWTRI